MLSTLIIILSLIVLEGLLSVDNAAVLATMVKDLPGDQSKKALRYGLLGAYIGRFLCLAFAAWIMDLWWLKPVGGFYLIYLWYKSLGGDEETSIDKFNSPIYRLAGRMGMSVFWATIIMVEFMDLVFSIDNVFAAVALSSELWVVMVGVGIGILIMRFVAGKFINLMKVYPSLAKSAYIVILLLGIKLVVSGVAQGFIPSLHSFLENQWFSFGFSISMLVIFLIPLLKRREQLDDYEHFV